MTATKSLIAKSACRSGMLHKFIGIVALAMSLKIYIDLTTKQLSSSSLNNFEQLLFTGRKL